MSTSNRPSGGSAALIAAAALVLSAIQAGLLPPDGIVDSPGEYVYRGLVLVAYGAVIAAVLGLHQAHHGLSRYGWLGTLLALLRGSVGLALRQRPPALAEPPAPADRSTF